jgi:hypothetical protein
MPNVIKLNVVMRNVIMLTVVMLNVMAPSSESMAIKIGLNPTGKNLIELINKFFIRKFQFYGSERHILILNQITHKVPRHQHNNIRHNDTQHNTEYCNVACRPFYVSLFIVMLSHGGCCVNVIMLNVVAPITGVIILQDAPYNLQV